MINVFVLQNGRLSQVNIDTRADLERAQPIWVDLTDPSDEERDWVKSIYGVTLPDEDEVKDIEASARYYEADNGDLHLRSDFLLEEDEGESRVVTVAFILAKNMLFSMHSDDLPVFRLLRMRARSRPGSIGDFKDVLLDLYATDVEYSADALEGIYLNLEEVSRSVLQKEFSDQDAAESLSAMARSIVHRGPDDEGARHQPQRGVPGAQIGQHAAHASGAIAQGKGPEPDRPALPHVRARPSRCASRWRPCSRIRPQWARPSTRYAPRFHSADLAATDWMWRSWLAWAIWGWAQPAAIWSMQTVIARMSASFCPGATSTP